MRAFKYGFFGCFGVAAAIFIVFQFGACVTFLSFTGKSNGSGETQAERVGTSRANPVPINTPWVEPRGLEFTVLSFLEGPPAMEQTSNIWSQTVSATSGNKYVVIQVRTRNVGETDKPITITGERFQIIGSSGKVFDSNLFIVRDGLNGELYKGGATEGNVLFEVPEAEKDMLLIYEPVAFDSDKYFLALE